jgi:hypothetical protein
VTIARIQPYETHLTAAANEVIRLRTLERRIPWLFLAVPAAFLLGLCIGGAM